MKIKSGFTIKQVAGSYVVMCHGSELDFNGLITLNETGALIWRLIDDGKVDTEIADIIASEYEVDRETALNDVRRFINRMVEANVLE